MEPSGSNVNNAGRKKPYRSIGDELFDTYGGKVYKLSLQTGCGCPNRDGTKGRGGCIFCGEKGSGEFAESCLIPIGEQIELAKNRVRLKAGKSPAGYIAYFQSFTNTYGEFGRLSGLFREAIENPDILILSIATRPDSISDEMYGFLGELNKIKPVWVELGLQTVHEDTARFIRRGYEFGTFEEAVKRLKREGITVITHMIAGLPGESEERIKETAGYISELSDETGQPLIDGMKIHLLYVLEGTDLGRLYKEYGGGKALPENGGCEDMLIPFEGSFIKWHIFSMEEYVSLVTDILERLPERIVVHRITGDAPKSLLIAPKWSGDKKRVLNAFTKEFKIRESYQGKRRNKNG